MAIRYFKKPEASASKLKDSSPIVASTTDSKVVATKQASSSEEEDNSDESEGESSEEESSEEENSSSSSEEEEIKYHKPVFLKRKVISSSKPSIPKAQESSNSPTQDEHDKKQLSQRVAHSLNVTRNLDINTSSIDENYSSTDKELLKRTLLLNDDDTIDPVLEKTKWEARQRARQQRERQLLVGKQLEAEAKQERILKRSVPIDQIQTNTETRPNKELQPKRFKKRENYNPQRAMTIKFGQNIPSTTSREQNHDDNEYSHL